MNKKLLLLPLFAALVLACSESDNSHNLPNNNSNNTSNNSTTTSNNSTNNDSIGTNNSSTTNETSGTVGPDDFDVLREVKSALELSPDQRTRRAHKLVETGDLAQIFEFVRDEIRVTPVSRLNQRFEPMASRSLFGPRGTLRGGLGSMRDKAELLEFLFEEAGFEARVRVARPLPELQTHALLFAAKTPPAFEIDYDASQATDTLIAPEESEADPLFDRLIDLVQPTAAENYFPDLEDVSLPIVEVQTPEGPVIANPHFADLEFGEPGVGDFLQNSDNTPTASTRVRLWARHTDDEDFEGRTLVEGQWLDSELIGRRIVARTRAPLTLSELLFTRAEQLHHFIPMLTLEGEGLPDGEGVSGDLFSTRGERLSLSEGRVHVDGLPLDPARAEAADEVRNIELEIDAAGFPRIRVLATPTDANGDVVLNLQAENFLVTEDASEVGATLRRNRYIPRVLFLVDRSTSIPEDFRNESLSQLGIDIATEVLQTPDAQVSVMGIGESRAQRQPFVSDLVELEAQFDAGHGSGSALWDALSEAVRRKPTLIVLITDGVVVGSTLTPRIESEIRRAGVPVLALGVGEPNAPTLEEAAELSGGQYFEASDAASAKSFIESELQNPPAPYLLTYTAPSEGPQTRTLKVGIRGFMAEQEGTYEAPAESLPAGFVGLYLSVERDGQSITRTLAGIPPEAPMDSVSAQTFEDVQAAFLGSATLLVEGGMPAFSEVLDEKIDTMLDYEPMWDARENAEEFWPTLDQGFRSMPFFAYRHFWGVDTTQEQALPGAPRFVLYTDRPGFRPESIERRVDILPFTRWHSTLDDLSEGWRAALRASVKEALLEAAYFEESTISLLDQETLEALPAEDLNERVEGLPNAANWLYSAESFDDDWTLVIPSDLEPVAFWAIHEPTGTALAIVDGGGGSGSTGGGNPVNSPLGLYDSIQYFYTIAGFKGGVWVNLEIAKAKQVAYATAAIANLGSGMPFTPPAGTDAPSTAINFVCGEAENAVLDAIPGWARFIVASYNRSAAALGWQRACP